MPPVNLGGPAAFIAAGMRHACAILRTGEVRCWGRGVNGVLGYADPEDIGDDETPASAGSVALLEPAIHLSASETHTCAVLASGAVQCWGDDVVEQLGGGAPAIVGTAGLAAVHAVIDPGARVTQIAAGSGHTCALLEDGGVRCWGENRDGKLGAASETDRTLSAAALRVDLGAAAVQLEAHSDHTCAVLATRELMCWGAGNEGNLGYGNDEDVGDDETPASLGPVPVF